MTTPTRPPTHYSLTNPLTQSHTRTYAGAHLVEEAAADLPASKEAALHVKERLDGRLLLFERHEGPHHLRFDSIRFGWVRLIRVEDGVPMGPPIH